jgi:hypothetical protein
VIDRDGVRRDIQLKGSGPTPFSRRGDGRAALGPVLREYDHRSVTLQGREKGHGSRYRGYPHFRDADKKPQFAIVSVKGGENINSAMVRDLKGTMEREKAALGFS